MFEGVVSNLHVLGALSDNDKLMTSGDQFDIYAPTTLRGVMRMWYGEKRGMNVSRVRDTVRSAIALATSTVDEVNTMATTLPLSLRTKQLALQHVRICEALHAAEKGLHHLQHTYRDDPAVHTQISLVREEVRNFHLLIREQTESMRLLVASPPPARAAEGEEPPLLPPLPPQASGTAEPAAAPCRSGTPSAPAPAPPPGISEMRESGTPTDS